VEDQAADLKSGLWLLLGLTSLGVIVVVFLASQSVTSPLRDLVRSAEGARVGGHRVFPPGGSDEFAVLGRAIDNLSGRLEDEIERLEAGKGRLEAVLRGMAEAVMVTDSRGAIVLVNEAFRRTFQVEDEVIGKGAFEVLRVAELQEKLEQVLSGGGAAAVEFAMQHPARLVLAGSVVPLIEPSGAAGAVAVFHDITELKRLEQVRKDFIANISHELRTPLSSIRGYAETLASGALEEPERALEFVNIIRRHSERLSSLLFDILSLSRIESGESVLRKREFDLVQAALDTVEQLEEKAAAKQIQVQTTASSESLPVMASREFIDQVLVNLVDNAIKYSPPGSRVEVRLTALPQEVQVDVADNGIGIPAEDLDRVFERFYRVPKDRSRKVEGTGLGLAIAKNIIAAHHGRIWVESELGKGSTFSFVIPRS